MFEAISVIVIFYTILILAAPEGYEDSSGFHYGKPKEQPSRNSTETDNAIFTP